jgi:hypothetical protein
MSTPTLVQTTRINIFAIVALVTGVLGMAVIPIVFGHISLSQIKKTGEQGRGMAIAGLVLGYLALVAIVIIIVAAVALVVSAASMPGGVSVTRN